MAEYLSEDITLKRGDNVGGTSITYNDIGSVSNIDGDGIKVNTIEEHYLGSDTPTVIAGNKTLGTKNFTITYDPDNAQHAGLLSDKSSKVNRDFRITITGATAGDRDFSGYVTDVGESVSVGEKLKCQVSIKVSSDTDWA